MFGPIFPVPAETWLQSVAGFVLSADDDALREVWNVSAEVSSVRRRLTASPPGDLRTHLGLAQALLQQAHETGDTSVLDFVLVSAAQVMERDTRSGKLGAVGMLVFLSPPLARADTFARSCHVLEMVPAG